jgi:hypothetical protein
VSAEVDYCVDGSLCNIGAREEPCCEYTPKSVSRWRYLCTRAKGHEGPHVACGGTHNLATWAADEPTDEVAEARAAQISGFYEDRVPQFRQGPPVHELESLVTADEVAGYVRKIEELRAKLKAIADGGYSEGCGFCKRHVELARGTDEGGTSDADN